jgi:UDP-N-acetylmuramoyl-L-alanyl-D-glutamate--2,6-diaminopimelate ligase
MIRLRELARRFGGRVEARGDADPLLRDVFLDSRQVTADSLFAALPGAREDGGRFLAEAVTRGAAAALLPTTALGTNLGKVASSGLPLWLHPEARQTVGRAAAAVHGDPADGWPVIAVTGTNGKTTVAWVAAALLRGVGRQPALFGTVGYFVAGAPVEPAPNTTPDATVLQRSLARHRARGGDCAVLEASSHALDQRRLAGLPVSVAVFTNLTRDHLDYHGDFDHYRAAKGRLFEALAPGSTAVLPECGEVADDFARRAAARGARVLRYGTGSRADLCASRLVPTPQGLSISISGMGIPADSKPLSLSGRHNVENVLAAVAAVLSTGASPAALLPALASVTLPPGRLELVSPPGHPFRVLVDYAHSPDALRAVLGSLREELAAAGSGRLLCVFGCGGDRDRGKRAPMGQAVGELADVAVLSSDNPRSEDPRDIAEQVRAGLQGTAAEAWVELDRRRAIALAIDAARPGDVVLIAGKGHEDYQILPSGRIHFDDREVAREVLG